MYRRQKSISLTFLALLPFSLSIVGQEGNDPRHDLVLDPPAMVWDEALPLGNGLLGALVWGDGHPLKVSLDRTDLWDLRPVPEFHSEEYSFEKMKEWVAAGRVEDLRRVYEAPYNRAGPTKIPAGRIEIETPGEVTCRKSVLSIGEGVASVDFGNGTSARIWIHSTQPVGFIEFDLEAPIMASVIAPAFTGPDSKDSPPGISAGELARLGYPPPVALEEPDASGFLQEGWDGFHFAVALVWERTDRTWRAAWSIATSKESSAPLDLAKTRARKALSESRENQWASHVDWWRDYWKKSSVRVPNATIERQWYLDTYKFGAAARTDTPPITLQGPWTADDGQLPPWKGDYHHDLNTELSYWPCYSGNRLEEGSGFLRWLWDTRAHCVDWTRRFFDKPGMNVPMTADLLNRQIGGWHQYTHSSTTACWLAHHFYLHWQYSRDPDFLRDRAYPYLAACAEFIEAVTRMGPNGLRTLTLSSSPEINDNRLEAWFPSLTNYDLALIRWLLGASAELAAELGLEEEETRWRRLLYEFPELALDPSDGRLLVAQGIPLQESHRHLSHLMSIHPLGIVRWENGEKDQRTIQGALQEMDRLGTSKWTGYSFAWKACMAARARDGRRAEEALEIFSEAFCLRNSFHCNGDQSGRGYSDFTYRPFTLEGNFAAAAALQEMLLQSYSGVIRVFPAIPEDWREVAFQTLRAEGAFLVSARRQKGKTTEIEILSQKGGACRLGDPFEGRRYSVRGLSEKSSNHREDLIVFDTKPGDRCILVSLE